MHLFSRTDADCFSANPAKHQNPSLSPKDKNMDSKKLGFSSKFYKYGISFFKFRGKRGDIK